MTSRPLVRKPHFAMVVAAIAMAFAPYPSARADVDVTRLGGRDRYETMAQLCEDGFTKSSWACLATGENFPDALSASPLAGMHHCPIILTETRGLSDAARDQMLRLGTTDVIVLGGLRALPNEVERDLLGAGFRVHRVAGNDRYATAVAIMNETREAGSTSDTVIIVTGDGFADSLSIGPWAYANGAPILLARGGLLGNEAVKAIRKDKFVKRILIVGGTAVVSDGIRQQLGSSYTYQRVAGIDRFRTSAAIAEWESTQGLGWDTPSIATGQKFPDALAGAALSGSRSSAMLLVSEEHLDTLGIIARHSKEIGQLDILGGPKAISDRIMNLANWLLNAR